MEEEEEEEATGGVHRLRLEDVADAEVTVSVHVTKGRNEDGKEEKKKISGNDNDDFLNFLSFSALFCLIVFIVVFFFLFFFISSCVIF